MKRLTVLTIALMAIMPLWADQTTSVNDLYDQIDDAIKESPVYVATYENKINDVKTAYLREKNPARQLSQALQLFDMYKAFNNDSALYYIGRSIALAEQNDRPDLVAMGKAKMAFQCSAAGMYTEARELLEEIDKSALTHEGLGVYYHTYMHLYGEIACYTHLDKVRDRYFRLQEIYRDSAIRYLTPGSQDYLMVRQMMLVNHGDFEEAMKVNDEWQNAVMEGSHEHAIAAYYRHVIYDKMGNVEKAEYWLAKSALSDIRGAIMDQASLIGLSDLLNREGDLSRSYRYIRFTWECNDRFNTRMRYWQLSPILTVIDKDYQDASSRSVVFMNRSVIGGSILIVLLLMLLYRNIHQKKRLLKAQEELVTANQQLTTANKKLQDLNECVVQYNKDLFAINKELQETYMPSTFDDDDKKDKSLID